MKRLDLRQFKYTKSDLADKVKEYKWVFINKQRRTLLDMHLARRGQIYKGLMSHG